MSGIKPEEIAWHIRSGWHPERTQPVILDIGCNDGEQTTIFVDLFPEGRVYSFEPDPRAQLRFLSAATRAHARCGLYPYAVGAVDGTVDFYPSQGMPAPLPKADADAIAAKLGQGGWDLSGSIRRPKLHLKHHPWCRFGDPFKVTVIRLDTWAQNVIPYSQVDFIWADVQGAEADLIAGGLETLKRTRFLYTEYSDHELYEGQSTLNQLLAMLPAFRVVAQYPEDVLLENTQWAR